MRQQQYLIPTLRDVPADAEVASHQLMLRAGLIRQLAAGVYTYLPLGHKILRQIENIVREEMDQSGAQEILMPAIQPAEIWKETGRWDVYGPELMRLYDRHEREFALGPTHEEVITGLMRDEIKSYKRLPMTLYQIQTKYRDERRPRFGVLRAREFVMKDAYSFDTSPEALTVSYEKMYDAYTNIFKRCHLNFRAVEADSGAIGGTDTHEFMVLSDIGEDTIAYCDTCSYAANLEKAEASLADHKQPVSQTQEVKRKVETPDVTTIEALSDFLKVGADRIIKAVVFDAGGKIVMALVRGDYEINDLKVKNVLGVDKMEMLESDRLQAELGVEAGYIGPHDLPNVQVIADYSVQGMQDAITGANEKGYHFLHVRPERDFGVDQYADLRNVVEGDSCPKCGGAIQFTQGIEVGHVFQLGTKYSEAMGATYLDENGKTQPMVMGCYGIGISRLMAAIIEQHHDQNGLVWPASITPFHIHLIAVNIKKEEQKRLAEELYTTLVDQGYEVLFDDRDERAGVKFTDADLIGIPLRITVGKKAGQQVVECKVRKSGHMQEIKVDKLEEYLQESWSLLS